MDPNLKYRLDELLREFNRSNRTKSFFRIQGKKALGHLQKPPQQ
jgi:hypothetical protein